MLLLSLLAYVLLCAALYFFQERLLFYPRRLPAGYAFQFEIPATERTITTADGTRLSGLLFPVEHPKGLVFFLHGNGGNLADWGTLAPTYTRLGYDVFMLDYRDYGKSAGNIQRQAQLLGDVEAAYTAVTAGYPAGRVVLAGYSLGTGPAAWLATRHPARLLLLHAPYFNMTDMAARTIPGWPILPNWLLRYPLPTNEFVRRVAGPVLLFHGDQDEVIPYNSSVRLRALLDAKGQLITLPGAGHTNLLGQPLYQQQIRRLLSEIR